MIQQVYKRAASTVATGISHTIPAIVYLPSVSHLIHKHKLSPDLIERIPRTGPKNRLLKGDILAYLENPSILLAPGQVATSSFDSLSRKGTQEYWTVNVNLSHAYEIALKNGVSVQDVLVKAAVLSLKEVPELNPSGDIVFQKQFGLDISTVLVKDAEKAPLKKLVSKKIAPDSVSQHVFCIQDSTGSSIKDIYPVLTGRQTVLLSFEEKPALAHDPVLSIFDQHTSSSSSKGLSLDELSLLFGTKSSPSTVKSASTSSSLKTTNISMKNTQVTRFTSKVLDELDFFSSSGSAPNQFKSFVEVDLITDSSIVPSKKAQKYLSVLKNMIEKGNF